MLVLNIGMFEPAAVGIALAALAVCTWTDLRWGLILDRVTLPSLAIVLALRSLDGNSWNALVGCGVSVAAILSLHLVTRGRGMGLGDVKLAAVIGAVLGLGTGLAALGIAFVLGAVAGTYLIAVRGTDRRAEIRFGPYLAAGAGIALLVRGAV